MATHAIAAIEALEVASRVPKLTKELVDASTEVVESGALFAKKVTTFIEDAIAKVDSLHGKELRKCTEVRTACFELSEVYDIAYMFILKAEDTFGYACDETVTSRVKDEIMRNNFEPLTDFIRQMQRYLYEAGKLYVELNDACNKAIESSTRAAEFCKAKTREARSKKRATRAIGGTVAGGAIAAGATTGVAAGGVAASAIAGLFTFGIGTVIGLGITAVAATAVGVGGGATAAAITHCVAEDFEETEKNFRMCSEKFDYLANSALTLHKSVSGLHMRLEALATYVNGAESCRNHQEVSRSVCRAVNKLHQRSKESFHVLSDHRETVRVKTSHLRNKLQSYT